MRSTHHFSTAIAEAEPAIKAARAATARLCILSVEFGLGWLVALRWLCKECQRGVPLAVMSRW